LQKKYLILLLSLISICGYSQYQTETEYLNFEGYERSYEVYLPEKYSEKIKYPAVFVLHGGGGTAKALIRSTRARFNYLANRDGFIAVYPYGIQKSWNDGARDTFGVAQKLRINDVGFFEKMIEVLQSHYSIDQENIFTCGISNGGFMAQRLAFELSNKIKGIGVVAANLSDVQSKKNFPKKPVPVIFINGTEDPLVPYNGGHVTVFNKKKGKILSVDKNIKLWKEMNDCTEKSEVYPFPDTNKKDNCTAIKTVWQNQENQKIKVVAIKIENGGHTWPGTKQNLPKWLVGNTNGDFNGCDEIWNFFKTINN